MQANPNNARSGQPPPPKPPKITIPRLDVLGNAGNLKATFDARIGHDFLLRECRLIHDGNHDVYWVSPPVREYQKDGNKKGFLPLADWPRHWHDAIREAAVAAYEAKQAPTTFHDELRQRAGLGGAS